MSRSEGLSPGFLSVSRWPLTLGHGRFTLKNVKRGLDMVIFLRVVANGRGHAIGHHRKNISSVPAPVFRFTFPVYRLVPFHAPPQHFDIVPP